MNKLGKATDSSNLDNDIHSGSDAESHDFSGRSSSGSDTDSFSVVGDYVSDNSCLDSILNGMKEISKTDGQLDELPLFNINEG